MKKRKQLNNELNYHFWENTDQVILACLKNNPYCKFGNIMSDMNSKLGKENGYSRKGLDKILKRLIDAGKITTKPSKQGHFLYYLTKNGEYSIELISSIYQKFAYLLLSDNFVKKRTNVRSKEHFVERIVERMGVYLLFSCIEGLLIYTSPKQKFEVNIANIQNWASRVNPAIELFRYLDDFPRYFLDFKNEEDRNYSSTLQNKSLKDFLKELEEILRKKFPEECESLEDYKGMIASNINSQKEKNMTLKQRMDNSFVNTGLSIMKESEKINKKLRNQ